MSWVWVAFGAWLVLAPLLALGLGRMWAADAERDRLANYARRQEDAQWELYHQQDAQAEREDQYR